MADRPAGTTSRTLFTIQFSVKEAYYHPQTPVSTIIALDVFAPTRDEALEVARMILRHPDQYDLEDVTEY